MSEDLRVFIWTIKQLAQSIALVALAFFIVFLCVSCAAPPADYRRVWCLENEPWRPDAAEYSHYSRATKEAMLRHNEQGKELCRWKN